MSDKVKLQLPKDEAVLLTDTESTIGVPRAERFTHPDASVSISAKADVISYVMDNPGSVLWEQMYRQVAEAWPRDAMFKDVLSMARELQDVTAEKVLMRSMSKPALAMRDASELLRLT